VAALPPLPEPTPGIDTAISPAFQPHLPAVDAFPTQLWGRLWGRRWRTSAGPLLAPSAQAASAPLRTALADQLNAGRGLRCTAEQIIIVTGGQQALELVAHVLLDPGDKAWVEDPGSSGLRAVLISAGVHLCPVPVDGDGLAVAAGIARHGDARLAVVRPAHQWPTGVTMTLPRRLALLEWAYQAGAWVVEDDSGGAFAYTTHATTPLQALDQGARVLQIGSLSQLLFPALRLGYLIAPPDLVEPLLWVQHLTSRPPPAVDQAVLADFITGGHFAQHLRRLTDLYQERQSTLLAACQRELGEWLNVQPATAGFHLTGWLAPGLDDRAVAAQAAALGITVTPISPQRLIPGGPQGLALGYGGVRPELIGPAVQRLATVLEERR
jgi:GntR family transcriptional regulator / MocR family aminotransferase